MLGTYGKDDGNDLTEWGGKDTLIGARSIRRWMHTFDDQSASTFLEP